MPELSSWPGCSISSCGQPWPMRFFYLHFANTSLGHVPYESSPAEPAAAADAVGFAAVAAEPQDVGRGALMFSGYRDEDLRDRRHSLEKRYRSTSGWFAVSIIISATAVYVCTSIPPSSMPAALAELTTT